MFTTSMDKKFAGKEKITIDKQTQYSGILTWIAPMSHQEYILIYIKTRHKDLDFEGDGE